MPRIGYVMREYVGVVPGAIRAGLNGFKHESTAQGVIDMLGEADRRFGRANRDLVNTLIGRR